MHILIADKFEDSGMTALREAGCEVTFEPSLKDAALIEALGKTKCDILIVRSTKVPVAALEASPNLKIVIRAGSGYDTIDYEGAKERNIRVCNCPGMNAVAVAELTLGMMIALDRRIVDCAIDIRRGVWNKKEYSKARGLKGRTLGVVGLGRIGYEVAKRAAAFDMKLIYSDVVEHKSIEQELGIQRVEMDELLANADFVTLHVPGGGGTKHMIGAAELAKMKPTAFVFNCSRGGVIDQKALDEALKAGTIGGAALDVYELEPAATDKDFADPIKDQPKVYGTHHIGASTEQAQNAVAEEAVRIVTEYQNCGTFRNCVNA